MATWVLSIYIAIYPFPGLQGCGAGMGLRGPKWQVNGPFALIYALIDKVATQLAIIFGDRK